MDRSAPEFVTVGYLDGTTKVGRCPRFSPRAPDLPLEIGGGSGGRPVKLPVPAERLAWVGIHRHGEPSLPKSGGERVLRRIHVAGAKSFVVRVLESAVTSRLGFYAQPDERGGQFEEIWFYTHGVNAVENVALLGSMLVEEGVITAEDLERGLSAHLAQRGVPIGQILLEQQKITPSALEQAVTLQARRRSRLGEVLVEEGLASAADVEAALAEQKKRSGKRLGEVLVEMNIVSEARLAQTLARKFRLPFVDLDSCAINLQACKEVPRDLVARHGILPVDSDDHVLTVALSDPLAMDAMDQLRFQANKHIREVLVPPGQLRRAVERFLQMADGEALAALGGVDQILKELATDPLLVKDDDGAEGGVEMQESDSAVIKLAHQIILDAYRDGASDIHIEPNGRERSTMVRFRVDGDCVAYKEIPPAYRRSLVARLKVMAQMDLSERRKPQDGKIRLQVHDKKIELRMATIPTAHGNEDVVLRVLAVQQPAPLDKMGMSPANLATYRQLIKKPYGLVLCVGPTGSGKTTTLHSTLAALNDVDTKIWTAEDPVEITQPGLRQVQVNPRIGFTFASALRAFLRADPDVIMVGEMRDQETAQIAVEASLTGHLVFSTLHTNSAPETITRLLDMGLDPFSFSDALLGVLAQRLVRALCRSCREPYEGTRTEWDELASICGKEEIESRLLAGFGPDFRLFRPRGCNACSNTGYQGRVALHELLVSDERTRELVGRRAPVEELRKAARAGGMRTLLEDGAEKALAGLVDMRQVVGAASR